MDGQLAQAFKKFIDDLGGPEQLALAVASGSMDRYNRVAAQKFFGAFDGIVPKDHPSRSRWAEMAAGIAQAIVRLKPHGPIADFGHSFVDYGQKRWFNGTSADKDWLAEFEQYARQQLAQAEDPKAEALRLNEVLQAQKELSKSIGDLRSELMPDAGEESTINWDPVANFLGEAGEIVEGLLDRFNAWAEARLAKRGVNPQEPS